MAWTHQLGEEIAKKRRQNGKSQKGLGNDVGVSRQMISQYESGSVPPPFEILARIAEAVKADEFVVEDLHVKFSRNGKGARPEAIPQQLILDFDVAGGVAVRIERTPQGVLIKKMTA
ncbi:MAG TPA: helix-turn-helix transcriptional regulator [Candidatus Eisenbacteria bacterium]|nr:helix-turn-helix transcriptional regulator [Candidatus Eisenbacteria bacterium]